MVARQSFYLTTSLKKKIGTFLKKRSGNPNSASESSQKRPRAFSITYENGEVENVDADDVLNGFCLTCDDCDEQEQVHETIMSMTRALPPTALPPAPSEYSRNSEKHSDDDSVDLDNVAKLLFVNM